MRNRGDAYVLWGIINCRKDSNYLVISQTSDIKNS